MKNFQELKELVNTAEADAIKFFEKGNQTAGTRLRQAMLQVRSIAQSIRKEVSEAKNSTH